MLKKYKKQPLPTSSFLFIIGLLVAGCVFIFESLQCFGIIYNWDNNGTSEYYGQYMLSKEHFLRNTNYKFVLENGDILTVPCEYAINTDFENYPKLAFRYASQKSIFTLGKYRVVSIQSKDGGCLFVEENTTTQEMRLGAVGFMIIGVLCVLVSCLPFIFSRLIFF
ncbi:MAG: hypothetical protein J6Q92_03130 [Oscillospiraceae bacterium]|nr:hypothetical protein [Oscillospiraceae bacterium]